MSEPVIYKLTDGAKAHLDNMLEAGRAFALLKKAMIDELQVKVAAMKAEGDSLIRAEWMKMCAAMGIEASFEDPQWFLNTFFYDQTGDAYLVYSQGTDLRQGEDFPFLLALRQLKEKTEIN